MPNGDVLVAHDNQLLVVPKTGGAARKFANPENFSWWFRWSPDNKRLSFTRNQITSQTVAIGLVGVKYSNRSVQAQSSCGKAGLRLKQCIQVIHHRASWRHCESRGSGQR